MKALFVSLHVTFTMISSLFILGLLAGIAASFTDPKHMNEPIGTEVLLFVFLVVNFIYVYIKENK